MNHTFADELEVALREQGFGIVGYQIDPTPSDRAVIKLLDNGRTIYVQLSLRGWEVSTFLENPCLDLTSNKGSGSRRSPDPWAAIRNA